MAQQISAAGRLLAILGNAVRLESGKPVSEVWATVFSLQTEQRAALLQAVAGVHALVDQAKVEVAEHPELNQRLFLGTLANIEAILGRAQLEGQWGQVAGQLQGANLIALEFVADQLDRLSNEAAISEDSLATLRRQIEEVVSEILESDIEPTLKRLLITKLEEARQAVIDYRLTGVDGLRRAAETGIGALVIVKESIGNDANKKGFIDYIKALGDILDLVEKARPYLALAMPAVKALLSAGP